MFDFLTEKFSSVFSRLTGQRYLTETNIAQTLEKVHEALIEADVPFSTVNAFIEQLKQEVVGKKVLTTLNPGEQFIKLVHDKLVSFLGAVPGNDQFLFNKKSTVLVMGLQGSGKTTTIGKLAHYALQTAHMRKQPAPKILCASVDYYRPAAIDQLEILANKARVSFYRAQSTDVVQAAQEIVHFFKQHEYTLLFLDTAGRLHIDNNLLAELKEINQVVQPNTTLLVLDAMTGQESLRVAQAFDQAVGFTGGILTKIDSETRAGVAFGFCFELKKPLLFVGSGEKLDELEAFHPNRMATRMLGMGDVQSLLEKAQHKIKQVDQENLEKSLKNGVFTLDDFAKQIDMMNSLGSFSQVLKYIPGVSGAGIKQEAISQGESQMKQFRAVINSMTRKERLNHRLLDGSRKQRVAKGAGVPVSVINILIDRFEQMQQFVKLVKKSGKFSPFNLR
ncbi:MAG: Signal recognition particle protein [Candidatus Dependentiae bacterium ADurb.Bin331]|nr:MAG: Signal recognition particle protein [Candidatus Dependentiae bacterium ADurb.Bin331]